jgi:hypothetical protein
MSKTVIIILIYHPHKPIDKISNDNFMYCQNYIFTEILLGYVFLVTRGWVNYGGLENDLHQIQTHVMYMQTVLPASK